MIVLRQLWLMAEPWFSTLQSFGFVSEPLQRSVRLLTAEPIVWLTTEIFAPIVYRASRETEYLFTHNHARNKICFRVLPMLEKPFALQSTLMSACVNFSPQMAFHSPSLQTFTLVMLAAAQGSSFTSFSSWSSMLICPGALHPIIMHVHAQLY